MRYIITLLYKQQLIQFLMKKQFITEYDEQEIIVPDPTTANAKIMQLRADGINQLDIISDFDFTLTSKSKASIGNDSTFGVIAQSPFVSPEFQANYKALHDTYFPIERDPTISFELKNDKMKEWWGKSLKLISEQHVTDKKIGECLESSTLCFRHELLKFMDLTSCQRIPIYILSAGIHNVIKCAFQKALQTRLPSNVKIISNKAFKGFDGQISFQEPYICTTNKCHSLKRAEYPMLKKNAILMGDMLEDAMMTQNSLHQCVLKIGFLKNISNDKMCLENYKKSFDIVVKGNGSLCHVCKLLSFISNKSCDETCYKFINSSPLIDVTNSLTTKCL